MRGMSVALERSRIEAAILSLTFSGRSRLNELSTRMRTPMMKSDSRWERAWRPLYRSALSVQLLLY
jgi:hypothetical protein